MPAYKSSIFDLLNKDNLAIPDYQRPYKWTKRNIEELLTDISNAIEEGQKYGESYRYRIGTILIHNSQDGNLYIVDGQRKHPIKDDLYFWFQVGGNLFKLAKVGSS